MDFDSFPGLVEFQVDDSCILCARRPLQASVSRSISTNKEYNSRKAITSGLKNFQLANTPLTYWIGGLMALEMANWKSQERRRMLRAISQSDFRQKRLKSGFLALHGHLHQHSWSNNAHSRGGRSRSSGNADS